MRIGQLSQLLAALLGAAALAACAPVTPQLNSKFGDAVNQAKAQQTINPDASMDTDPVAGIDGPSANAAIKNYQKSFEKPATVAPVFTLGIGTSGGGGK